MKLYIIGNGFDRAHGLPTSYYDFRGFLQSTVPQFLSTFEDKYYLAYSAKSRNRNILWNDFERNLASISADVIVEEVNSMDLDLSVFIIDFLKNVTIDEIEVIGHSIADVDQDYFKLIDSITGEKVQWIVDYYEDDNCSNEEELQQNMLQCGVDKERIVMKNSKTFFDLR